MSLLLTGAGPSGGGSSTPSPPTLNSGALSIAYTGSGDGHIGDEIGIIANSLDVNLGSPPAGSPTSELGYLDGTTFVGLGIFGASVHTLTWDDANAAGGKSLAWRYTWSNASGDLQVLSDTQPCLALEPIGSPSTTITLNRVANTVTVTGFGQPWAGNRRPTDAFDFQWQEEVLGTFVDIPGATSLSLNYPVNNLLQCLVTNYNDTGAPGSPNVNPSTATSETIS